MKAPPLLKRPLRHPAAAALRLRPQRSRTPSMSGPLAALPPLIFNAGPFGKIAVNGIVTGFGMVQSNHVPGDDTRQATLSNGQIFIQKTDGKVPVLRPGGRLYASRPSATAFLAADKTVTNFYGPVPVVFVKLQAGKNT